MAEKFQNEHSSYFPYNRRISDSLIMFKPTNENCLGKSNILFNCGSHPNLMTSVVLQFFVIMMFMEKYH